MKLTVAALLVAAVAAEEPVWSLRSVQNHKDDSQVQQGYANYSTDHANERPPYDSEIQLADDKEEEEDHSKEKFQPWESGKEDDAAYKRVIPAHFSADSDDLFMRSMINHYAQEGKNKDGSPNGSFTVDEGSARAAASEVLNTHKGLSGASLQSYLNTYFAKAWAHFDVNRSGAIEVIKMPQFMRFLASDQLASLGQ
uniref:EF-hand domain-containing protein n=1 Tax=Strombidium inclinatum TaxID=197538 RepID=A0A7S3IGS5_9SPIT|mmetsp:Transcript_16268/g.25148  ORF Transcript_16268/g.25148 Transcript_16268/m.25148 type:complete len:197 (+) Transcript_16268:10-600(+)